MDIFYNIGFGFYILYAGCTFLIFMILREVWKLLKVWLGHLSEKDKRQIEINKKRES
jgi:hypothetical protein